MEVCSVADELSDDPKETIEYREHFESEYYETIKTANKLLGRGRPIKAVLLKRIGVSQINAQPENTVENIFEQLQIQPNAQTLQYNNQLPFNSTTPF